MLRRVVLLPLAVCPRFHEKPRDWRWSRDLLMVVGRRDAQEDTLDGIFTDGGRGLSCYCRV